MSDTVVDQFRSHNIWEQLDAFEATLSRTAVLLEGVEPDVASTHASLTALANYVRSLLSGANPVLVSIPLLEAIDGAITPTLNYLNVFEQNQDTDLILRAWTSSGGILTSVSDLPIVKARRDTKGLADAIASFEQQLINRVQSLGALADQIRATLAELRSNQEALDAEIEQQKGFLEAEIQKQTGLIEQAVTSFTTEFTADQEARSTEYAAALTQVKDSLAAVRKEAAEFLAEDKTLRPCCKTLSPPPWFSLTSC